MSADKMRRAAALVRERAEAVPARFKIETDSAESVAHIRSWHPAVTLLAADALDQHANVHGSYDCLYEPCAHEAFAAAYLGEQS